MHPFDANLLLFPTAAIFLVTLSLGLGFTRRPGISLFVALAKGACFFVYFNLFFDGTYWFWDDWRYLRGSQYLYEQGVGLHPFENFPLLFVAAGGDHFVYYVHNIYAITLFGEGYFAPVALNIILTSLVAWMGASLAEREFNWRGDLRDAFFFFLLLAPDILAWSTIMNDKDILVLLLHVMMLCGISDLYRRRIARGMFILAPTIAVLLFLRFYVPPIFAASMVATAFIAGERSNRIWWFSAGLATVAGFVALKASLILLVLSKLQANLMNPLSGFPRFLLTPIPFNTDAEYAFLNLPAIFHWLMLPFLFLGIFSIAQRKTPFVRFFLIYFLAFVTLYSIYSELQGPRQRVQLDFAWAAFEFAGIIYASQRTMGRAKTQQLQA